jgi:hypothetical protein
MAKPFNVSVVFCRKGGDRMTFPDPSEGPSVWAAPAGPVADLIRIHRDQVLAYTTVPSPASEGAGPPGTPPGLVSLPADIVRLVERYEAEHPGVRLMPLRYVSVGSPSESTAVTLDAALPSDSDLVSLIVTETMVDAGRVEVRSRILLAGITRPAEG